jgi:hypothetical protein
VVVVVVVRGGGGRGRVILHFKSSQKFCKVIAIIQLNQTNSTVRYFTYETAEKRQWNGITRIFLGKRGLWLPLERE